MGHTKVSPQAAAWIKASGKQSHLWLLLLAELGRRDPDGFPEKLDALCVDNDPVAAIKIGKVCDAILNPGHGHLTDRQRRALELVIARSENATEFGKKAVIWLLRQSDCLRINVAASFTEEQGCQQVQSAVHDMVSCNGTTHLDEKIRLTAVDLRFSHHYGRYDSEREFRHDSGWSTIWISTNGDYDHGATVIPVDMEAIGAISLNPEEIKGKDFYASRHRT